MGISLFFLNLKESIESKNTKHYSYITIVRGRESFRMERYIKLRFPDKRAGDKQNICGLCYGTPK
jgi:hypothetical protein